MSNDRRPRRRPPRPLCALMPLLAVALSACAGGPPDISIGIGLDPPPCAAAGNPSACRLHRELSGDYTQPNARDR